MEDIVASMQRRHANQVADLHASLERLKKVLLYGSGVSLWLTMCLIDLING